MPNPANWNQMTLEQKLDWLVKRTDFISASSANVNEANQIFANAFHQIGELKKEISDLKAAAIR